MSGQGMAGTFTSLAMVMVIASVHVYQKMVGCEMNENRLTRGFQQYGYDGDDFLVFDLENLQWVAASQLSVPTKDRWNSNRASCSRCKQFVDQVCLHWLKNFVSYREKTPPEVRIIPRKSDDGGTLTLSCMVTGFYPRAVDVNWIKNGETALNDTISNETLPNEDRTFQIKKSIEIHSADTNTYSCLVDHSSLNTNLNVPYDPKANGNPTVISGIIIGVGIVGILIVAIAGFLVWKYKGKGTKREGYIPAKLQSLKDTTEKLGTRLAKAEGRISAEEDRGLQRVERVAALESKLDQP
ncbi:major histocompatibility complex class I-related gene protein-like [Latimeria chalumnae]|uniref:major histocompatibility complex class I-related gene protein-like n=1 Tax=Latimeria chalumnae TaxID=7897 RepID=UPI00313C002E